MADVNTIADELRKRMGSDVDLGGSVKLDFEHDGVVVIDGNQSPPTVSTDDAAADCTITVAMDTFKEMADGSLDPTTAFMTGKLKVDGDMGLAMKLGPLLQA